MSNLTKHWIVLCLLSFKSIQSAEICDFSDVECMTRSAKKTHKILIAGVKGKVDSSDPLKYEKLEGDLLGLKYKFTDNILTGIGDCDVTLLECKPKDMTYQYTMRCPKLILKSIFDLDGPLGPIQLKGNGNLTVTAVDYIINYTGLYGKFIDESDNTPRVYVKTFNVATEPKGKVTFEPDNLVVGDKEKSDLAKKFFNENFREIENFFKKPVIDVLLTKVLENISEGLKIHHLEELIPKSS